MKVRRTFTRRRGYRHLVTLPPCHRFQDRLDHAQQGGFGADLDEDRTALRGQGFDAIDKAHGLTQMLPPVGGVGQLGGDHFAGHARDDGALWGVEGDLFADERFKLVQNWVKQGRVGGHWHGNGASFETGRFQCRSCRPHMFMATGDDHTVRTVDHADHHISIRRNEGCHLGF